MDYYSFAADPEGWMAELAMCSADCRQPALEPYSHISPAANELERFHIYVPDYCLKYRYTTL